MMIKNSTKFVLIAGIGLSLFSGLSQAMFLKKGAYDTALVITNPSAPARLGSLALIHDDEGFSVLNKSEIRRIPNHLVDKDLRGISQDEVKARLENNINFRVQQGSDGEFSVQENGGLDGGLPSMGEQAMKTGMSELKKIVDPNVATIVAAIAAHGADVSTSTLAHAASITACKAALISFKPILVYGGFGLGVGAAGIGLYYVVPRVYNAYRERTPEEQGELDYFKYRQGLNQCLLAQNQGAERDANGMPSACGKQLRKFAIVAKSPTEVDDIVNAIRKLSKKN